MKVTATLLLLIVGLTALATQACDVAQCECDDNCSCTGKSSSLADNKQRFCDLGPAFMGAFVFRGVPTAATIDTTIPSSGIREDEFKILQVFKGDWNMMTGDKVTVKYEQAVSSCPAYPYDMDGMQVVIFGAMNNGKVEIIDCQNVQVYYCMGDQATFNTYTTSDPCAMGGDGGDGGNPFGF